MVEYGDGIGKVFWYIIDWLDRKEYNILLLDFYWIKDGEYIGKLIKEINEMCNGVIELYCEKDKRYTIGDIKIKRFDIDRLDEVYALCRLYGTR